MTAALLKKRSRIIEQISTMKNKRILDKIDKILAEADSQEEYIRKIDAAEEALKQGKTIGLEELKARVKTWQ
jgi:hypothetical protein